MGHEINDVLAEAQRAIGGKSGIVPLEMTVD